MPRNNLSRRYNPLLAERNDRWDKMFCCLFWSPFEIDEPDYQTDEDEPVASGRISSLSGSTPEEDAAAQLSSKMESLNVTDTDSSAPDPLAMVVVTFRESSDGDGKADPGYDYAAQQLPFQCPECSKRFRLRQYLRAHSVVHTEERRFGCDCGKRFRRRNALYNHRKRTGHHDWQAPDAKCIVCDQQFRSSAYLARHTAAACARYKAAARRLQATEEIQGV